MKYNFNGVSNFYFYPQRLESFINQPFCVHGNVISLLLLLLSSFVYHRIILSTRFIGAMLWSMARLRRGQLRMVVYVVGSCWWCDQPSVLARHTHILPYPPVLTYSWMICTDRPQFAVCLESSSVFDSSLLPWRLLLGPLRWRYTRNLI